MGVYWDQQPFNTAAVVIVPVTRHPLALPSLLVVGTIEQQMVVAADKILDFLRIHAAHTFITDDAAGVFWTLSQVAADVLQEQTRAGRLHDVVLFDLLLAGLQRDPKRKALHFEEFWQRQGDEHCRSRDSCLRAIYVALLLNSPTDKEVLASALAPAQAFVKRLAEIHQEQIAAWREVVTDSQLTCEGQLPLMGLKWRVQDEIARTTNFPMNIPFTAPFRQEWPVVWHQCWQRCSHTLWEHAETQAAFSFDQEQKLSEKPQGRIVWKKAHLCQWLQSLVETQSLWDGHPLPPVTADRLTRPSTWKRLQHIDSQLAAWCEADTLVRLRRLLEPEGQISWELGPLQRRGLLQDRHLSPLDNLWHWNWLRRQYDGPVLSAPVDHSFLILGLPNLEYLALADRLRKRGDLDSAFHQTLCKQENPVNIVTEAVRSSPELSVWLRGANEKIAQRLAATLLQVVLEGRALRSSLRLLEQEFNWSIPVDQLATVLQKTVFQPFPDLARYWQDDSLEYMACALGFTQQTAFNQCFLRLFFDHRPNLRLPLHRYHNMTAEDFHACFQQRSVAHVVRLFNSPVSDQERDDLLTRIHAQLEAMSVPAASLPPLDLSLYHWLTARQGMSRSGRVQSDMTFWESRMLPVVWTAEDAYAAVLFDVGSCSAPVVACTQTEIVLLIPDTNHESGISFGDKIGGRIQAALEPLLPELPVSVACRRAPEW